MFSALAAKLLLLSCKAMMSLCMVAFSARREATALNTDTNDICCLLLSLVNSLDLRELNCDLAAIADVDLAAVDFLSVGRSSNTKGGGGERSEFRRAVAQPLQKNSSLS